MIPEYVESALFQLMMENINITLFCDVLVSENKLFITFNKMIHYLDTFFSYFDAGMTLKI